ncbi:MAG: DUF393 domain-containing protein [Myxococcales bacterium]|nr:DUF393 domain-containing protein [Myxococcales bacterium]
MTSQDYVVEVFFDGDCPLCKREVRMIERLDRRRRIRLTDIAADDFDAASVQVSPSALMARIHGRLPDGQVIEGVEVFRRVYAALGLGPVVWLTRLPGISQLLDGFYHLFAKNRLRLTGRCTDETCAVHPKVHG